MKKVTLVVAVAISAFLIGCQESSNVNPISNDFAKSQVSKSNSGPDGSIELGGNVCLNPAESVSDSYNLSGTIQFTVVQVDNQTFAISVVTDASLQSVADAKIVGKASGESIEQVIIGTKQPAIHEQVYLVSGLDKEIELHLQFSVTPDDMQLTQAWIAESAWLDQAKSAK